MPNRAILLHFIGKLLRVDLQREEKNKAPTRDRATLCKLKSHLSPLSVKQFPHLFIRFNGVRSICSDAKLCQPLSHFLQTLVFAVVYRTIEVAAVHDHDSNHYLTPAFPFRGSQMQRAIKSLDFIPRRSFFSRQDPLSYLAQFLIRSITVRASGNGMTFHVSRHVFVNST